ncbi:MAG: putative Ig domain-containing protein [Pseudomonadota bacterium]
MLSATAVLLSGCLSDSEQSEEAAPGIAAVRITGSVGDGPVINAQITVRSVGGSVLTEAVSDATAEYDVLVDAAQGEYPLRITSIGGTDLVSDRAPDFTLHGVATNPGQSTTANVNPYGTMAVEIASGLSGGLTAANVNQAKSILDDGFDFGLVALDAHGAMYADITVSNVADIIRASEGMGEAIRRTRDKLSSAGYSATGDSVIRAVASDLTDGVLDGRGGALADARVSAVMTVTAAEVLLESMQNELHVYGTPATTAMDNAAAIVTGDSPSPLTGDLPVTQSMIRLASVGVAAGSAVSSDNALSALAAALDGLQAGSSATLVRSLVPNNYRSTLGALSDSVASADSSVISMINDVAGGRMSSTDPQNRAPTISGNPSPSVTAGSSWSFQPSAADPDGDTLSFSIANAPSWATFETSTGRLFGTPGENNVGSYAGIVITATDGDLSASLPAFTLTVNSASSGNAVPTISGNPPQTVTVGSSYMFVPTANDADGDTLTFSIQNLPSWTSFNPNNGALSGTPSANDVGIYGDITITVSDGSAIATLPAFEIAVEAANTAPVISGSAPTEVNANEAYSFTPTATDADGDSLSFSVSGLPAWASFNSGTGEVSGTPGDADVGVYTGIVISVSDGVAESSLPAFGITVNAVSLGSATLTWTPPTLNDDGSPLMDLAGYRLYWGTQPGVYTDSVTINDPGISTFVVENLTPGTYEFVSTAFNASGVESRYSNTATKIVE